MPACSRMRRTPAGSAPFAFAALANRASSSTGSNLPGREVVHLARRAAQAQHRLRGEHDERAARTRVRLAAQQVRVRGGRRRPGDRHVVLGGQLQVALDARGRVVGSLALVAVRQQHDDARALSPLLLGARDELVDDGLGAVREVAELRLPEHERIRSLDRVAVLEREGGVLAQQRVVDREAGLVLREVRQREPLLPVEAVVEDRVPRHEGAAPGILTREPHRGALEQEGAEGEQLAEAPVDLAVAAHLVALLQQLLQLRVHREALGRVVVRIADEGDDAGVDRGRGGLALLGDGVGLLRVGLVEVGDRRSARPCRRRSSPRRRPGSSPVCAAWVSAKARSRRSWKSWCAASYSSSVMSPRPTSASV